MDLVVVTYFAYLAITITLTAWVAQTLHKNGRVFLIDVFHGNESLADSVNHLLIVGFYLINFGYITLALKIGIEVASTRTAIEELSTKIGIVLLVLGAMHFGNLYIFNRLRQRALLPEAPPPVLPDSCTIVRESPLGTTVSMPYRTAQS